MKLSDTDIKLLNSTEGLKQLLKSKRLNIPKTLNYLKYEKELQELQIEAIKLQNWVTANNKRIVILYEGRDSAGKGGAIRRFVEHLNPRRYKVVALPKPSIKEKGQWYFQRYSQQLPDPGQIVLFDRSWYNRAVVEPVNGFCTKAEYKRHMEQIPEFERMLNDDGIILIKLWFSITKREQDKRFLAIKKNPLKQWKMSPVDEHAQKLWDSYTKYKEDMFKRTNTKDNSWVIVLADSKIKPRLESMKYILSKIPYEGKAGHIKWSKEVINNPAKVLQR